MIFISCDTIRIFIWNCRGWASFLGGLVAWGVEAFFGVVALGGLGFFLWISKYGYFLMAMLELFMLKPTIICRI
ncbi:MAG: hypothetical protein L6U16_11225 [Porphyromonadaceae bacterium]|nr:MAG: hypothetical protein L6U16_11225 [Porphyromonadaceae bacterium]